MKLEKLEIENFQVHEKVTIPFSKGITTILGPTDCGKSATLRALRWLCLNDFAGEDFIHEDHKRTDVILVTSDGITVQRSRSRGGAVNLYAVEEDEFKAFGQGVPQEVQEVLDVSEVNFQGQFDSPFWFKETAGEVSRRLNSIIDLTVIDTSLSYVGAEVRKAQERQALTEERLKEAKDDLEKIEPSRARIKDFKRVKDADVTASALRKQQERFSRLVSQVRQALDLSRSKAEQATQGEALLKNAKEVLKLQDRITDLKVLGLTLKKVEARAVVPPSFTAIEQAYEKAEGIKDKIIRLSDLLHQTANWSRAAEEKQKAAERADKKFHEKTDGQDCPICQRPLQ